MRVTYRAYLPSDRARVLQMELRKADASELNAATGGSVTAALCASLDISSETWVIEIGEELVGLFGVSEFGGIGCPWFVCTDSLFANSDQRAHFAHGSRDIIRGWRAKYPFLTNLVAKDHLAARRWLQWLGFNFIAGERFLSDPSVPFVQFYMEGDRGSRLCVSRS